MASRYEAEFALKDQMSGPLGRIREIAKQTENQLSSLDKEVGKLSRSTGMETWAKRSDAALKGFDKDVDTSIKKIAELRAAAKGIGDDTVTVKVKTDGVKETLAQLLAIRALQNQVSGRSATISAATRQALPTGFAQDFERLSSMDPRGPGSRPLFGGLDPSGTTATSGDSTTLHSSLDRLTRALEQATGQRTSGSFANPGRSLAPSAGGVSPLSREGGGGGGGLPGLPMPLMAALVPGAPALAAGLGATVLGGAAGLAAGAAQGLPAMAALRVGQQVLKTGFAPVQQAISASSAGLASQQQMNMQYPMQVQNAQQANQYQLAQQGLQYQQTLVQNRLSNVQQNQQLAAAGYGPGTFQYAQAQQGQALQQRQLAQQQAFAVAQMRQQQQYQMQLMAQQHRQAMAQALRQPGVTPQSIAVARQERALQAQMRTTFGGNNTRGREQYGAISGALGFAQGPGMGLLTHQWDAFFPVLDRTLHRLEHFGASKSGQDQIAMWTQNLPVIAGNLANVAGSALKLGGTLTNLIAPFTNHGLMALNQGFGRLNDYFNSPTGISKIHDIFSAAQPVVASTAHFVGALAQNMGNMATGGGGMMFARIMNSLASDVPKLVTYMNNGTNAVPGFLHALTTFGRIIGNVFGPTSGLGLGLGVLNSLLNTIHGVTSALSGPQMLALQALLGAGAVMKFASGSRGKMAGAAAGIGTTAFGLPGMLLGGLGLIPGLGGRGGGGGGGVGGAGVASAEAGGFRNVMSEMRATYGMARGFGYGRLKSLYATSSDIPRLGPRMGIPLALMGGLAAATSQGSSFQNALGLGVTGASLGMMTGNPLVALAGGVAGVGAGLLGLGGTGAPPKPQQPTLSPNDVTDSGTLQRYFGQSLWSKDTRHFNTDTWSAGGSASRWMGYGSQLTDQQALSISQQIKQSEAGRALSLGQIWQQYQGIDRTIHGTLMKHQSIKTLLDQQKAVLAQIAQTAPSTVRYDQFGHPVGINHAALIEQLTGSRHPTAAVAARTFMDVQAHTAAAARDVSGLMRYARKYDPGGPQAELADALNRGDMGRVAAIGAMMQHDVGLGSARGQALGAAFHNFSLHQGPNLSVDRQEQQALKVLVDQFGGTRPGSRFSQALRDLQGGDTARAHQAAVNRRTHLVGSAVSATAAHTAAWQKWWLAQPGHGQTTTIKTIVDDLRSGANAPQTKQVGQLLVHNLATGMDTQQSYNAINAAAKGIGNFIIKDWGAPQLLAGASNAGVGMVSSLASGVKTAAHGAAGAALNKAFFDIGFNAAWSAGQGARAGAPGSGPGGSPGSPGTAPMAASGQGSGFFPAGQTYVANRKDQGRDSSTLRNGKPGLIIAPGNGYLIRNASDPNGFGISYPIVHFTSGKYAGKDMYIGHTKSLLGNGAHFRMGQPIAQTQPGGNQIGSYGGNATVPGWSEIGYAPGGNPGPMGQPAPFFATAGGGSPAIPSRHPAATGGSFTSHPAQAAHVHVHINIDKMHTHDEAEYKRYMERMTRELRQALHNVSWKSQVS